MTGPRPAAWAMTKAREPRVNKPFTLIGNCQSPRRVHVTAARADPRPASGPWSLRPSRLPRSCPPAHPSGGHLPVWRAPSPLARHGPDGSSDPGARSRYAGPPGGRPTWPARWPGLTRRSGIQTAPGPVDPRPTQPRAQDTIGHWLVGTARRRPGVVNTVSTVPAAQGAGSCGDGASWRYYARPGLAGPSRWHRARPHGGPGAVARVTSPDACQDAPQIAHRRKVRHCGVALEFRPTQRTWPASAQSRKSLKDTRNSAQFRASNEYLDKV
jgi:hypothetical protein